MDIKVYVNGIVSLPFARDLLLDKLVFHWNLVDNDVSIFAGIILLPEFWQEFDTLPTSVDRMALSRRSGKYF